MTHSLYNLKTTPTGYAIAKFDADLNLEASYELKPSSVNGFTCTCPAGPRPSCKHRKMILIFRSAEAIDTDRFYDYERQSWHQPVVAYGEPEAPREELERVEGAVGITFLTNSADASGVFETVVAGEALGSSMEPIMEPVMIPDMHGGNKEATESLTAEDIEALPDGLEKDYQHTLQEVQEKANSIADLIINGNPELEGKLTGLLNEPVVIRRRI